MTTPKCNPCEAMEDTLQKVLVKLDRYLHATDPDIYDLIDVADTLHHHYESLKLANSKRS